ncbi:HNH endonuclease [Crossiella sp. CA198]|uniref:HNH endonuclease n=1 Tax=Crossiella sp. CA198 TaxID=3455607 RepID=UPI003F8D359F
MGKKTKKNRGKQAGTGKSVLLYHDMAVYEDFERCARRLFEIVRHAATNFPGKPRILVLDVQGHRNAAGGFDADALEIMTEFMGVLMPFLTELQTPMLRAHNRNCQREDLPPALSIFPPLDGTTHDYDVAKMEPRSRPEIKPERKTPPTKEQIAAYLGLSDPSCLICWHTPVERAHVVPRALGGSNSVNNFALLCSKHHQEAPDVADAEAFWQWVDYAELRDSHQKWELLPDDLAHLAPVLSRNKNRPEADDPDDKFFARVKQELRAVYDWSEGDFEGARWQEILEEYYELVHKGTVDHFGVRHKKSTHAWAYDAAKKLVDQRNPTGFTRRADIVRSRRLLAAAEAGLAEPASIPSTLSTCVGVIAKLKPSNAKLAGQLAQISTLFQDLLELQKNPDAPRPVGINTPELSLRLLQRTIIDALPGEEATDLS